MEQITGQQTSYQWVYGPREDQKTKRRNKNNPEQRNDKDDGRWSPRKANKAKCPSTEQNERPEDAEQDKKAVIEHQQDLGRSGKD